MKVVKILSFIFLSVGLLGTFGVVDIYELGLISLGLGFILALIYIEKTNGIKTLSLVLLPFVISSIAAYLVSLDPGSRAGCAIFLCGFVVSITFMISLGISGLIVIISVAIVSYIKKKKHPEGEEEQKQFKLMRRISFYIALAVVVYVIMYFLQFSK